MTFYLYFAMSIKFPLTQRAHLLISTNHRMEKFSKNDPWMIFNKITSSSMTLSEGNRNSFRICLANKRYFRIKSFSGERFSAVYIFLTWLQRRQIFCPLHFPDRAYLGPLRMSPVTGLARLQGRILWYVHMGNFSPVDWDEIQETQPKWWNINLYCSRLSWLSGLW